MDEPSLTLYVLFVQPYLGHYDPDKVGQQSGLIYAELADMIDWLFRYNLINIYCKIIVTLPLLLRNLNNLFTYILD